MLFSKYADHLPLYRQAQIYSRRGADLDRSTLADWVGRAAYELCPVRDALMADLKRSTKLFMDETRAPVLDPGHERPRPVTSGHSHAMISRGAERCRRVSSSPMPPVGAGSMPNGYCGAFAAFCGWILCRIQPLDLPGPDRTQHQLAHCCARARRKLIEITCTGRALIADEGLTLIRNLYAIEAEFRGRDPVARLAIRQERSTPILARINDGLKHHCARFCQIITRRGSGLHRQIP